MTKSKSTVCGDYGIMCGPLIQLNRNNLMWNGNIVQKKGMRLRVKMKEGSLH